MGSRVYALLYWVGASKRTVLPDDFVNRRRARGFDRVAHRSIHPQQHSNCSIDGTVLAVPRSFGHRIDHCLDGNFERCCAAKTVCLFPILSRFRLGLGLCLSVGEASLLRGRVRLLFVEDRYAVPNQDGLVIGQGRIRLGEGSQADGKTKRAEKDWTKNSPRSTPK